MKTHIKNLALISSLLLVISCSHSPITHVNENPIIFSPIQHASMVIKTSQNTIYIDPVGDISKFEKFPSPDIILITDIHKDHLNTEVIENLKQDKTIIIGPKAAIEKIGHGETLANGENKTFQDINIEAIPMYNLTEDRLHFHEKGRGNGYIITTAGKRIYISGDTEDIPEMRNLKNIDYAFVCMNNPYTMTAKQAASAVLEMKPKVAIPYHYRGKEGFGDIEQFKSLVEQDKNIEVRFLKWYD